MYSPRTTLAFLSMFFPTKIFTLHILFHTSNTQAPDTRLLLAPHSSRSLFQTHQVSFPREFSRHYFPSTARKAPPGCVLTPPVRFAGASSPDQTTGIGYSARPLAQNKGTHNPWVIWIGRLHCLIFSRVCLSVSVCMECSCVVCPSCALSLI